MIHLKSQALISCYDKNKNFRTFSAAVVIVLYGPKQFSYFFQNMTFNPCPADPWLYPAFANSLDPDPLASVKPTDLDIEPMDLDRSALFAIVNL